MKTERVQGGDVNTNNVNTVLSEFSDEELIKELKNRGFEIFKLEDDEWEEFDTLINED